MKIPIMFFSEVEDMDKLFAVLIGVLSGAIGYWFTTFWMKPILQYRELRIKVFADFIYYAQVVNAEGLNDQMKELYENRISSNRRNSADLAACLTELPFWYLWWLKRKGQSPERATSHLISYSNTSEYEQAAKVMKAIKKSLGFKSDE
ncbi:hypothetical protein HSX11_29040 [Oxalobacteraceae bacterium]|nr:hypothetical protein [Oxalobacteraceae bacterium]